jgi:tyrosyl-DNA phosphodiesterase-1
MADSTCDQEPSRKRAKLGESIDTQTNAVSSLASLERPITPPQRKSRESVIASNVSHDLPSSSNSLQQPMLVPSPFQLTRIQDLPAALNVDTVTLKDILGDPLISECWEFNYLHDINMLMEAFDPDVRDLVKVHVIHGFWKQEDGVVLKVCSVLIIASIPLSYLWGSQRKLHNVYSYLIVIFLFY